MLPHTRSVLWIAAHPDDELLVAPLLAHLSFNCGVRTTMLVLTQGERGPCHLEDTGDVDLATIRAAELQASATLVGARGIGWTLADGSAGTVPGVIANWSGSASRTALARRVAEIAFHAGADLMLAFDPTHGSTGHADHLAAGELSLDALRLMGSSAPRAFLVQSLVDFKPGAHITFRNARANDPRVISFDAHAHRTPDGASCWSYV